MFKNLLDQYIFHRIPCCSKCGELTPASAPRGACWKRRISGPTPRLLKQNLNINQIPECPYAHWSLRSTGLLHLRASCSHRLEPINNRKEKDVDTMKPGAFTSLPSSILSKEVWQWLAVLDCNLNGSSGSWITCEVVNTWEGCAKKEEKALLENLIKEYPWFRLKILKSFQSSLMSVEWTEQNPTSPEIYQLLRCTLPMFITLIYHDSFHS